MSKVPVKFKSASIHVLHQPGWGKDEYLVGVSEDGQIWQRTSRRGSWFKIIGPPQESKVEDDDNCPRVVIKKH